MQKFLFKTIMILLLMTNAVLSQNVVVDIKDVMDSEIQMAGFQIDSDQKIKIESKYYYSNSNYRNSSFAWILNSSTREVVWEIDEREYTGRSRRVPTNSARK